MEWVETTGKTVEEAKDAALDQLGVDEQDAEFEVLDEGKVGLFGRMRSEARVRARVRPTTPRAKEDRRDRKRRGDKTDKSAKAEKPERSPKSEASRTRDGARGGASKAPARSSGRSERPARSKPDNGGQQMDDVMVPMSEQSQVAEEFLRGLLREFGKDGDVATVEIDGTPSRSR
jgi:spoIIIJ-associated protein